MLLLAPSGMLFNIQSLEWQFIPRRTY